MTSSASASPAPSSSGGLLAARASRRALPPPRRPPRPLPLGIGSGQRPGAASQNLSAASLRSRASQAGVQESELPSFEQAIAVRVLVLTAQLTKQQSKQTQNTREHTKTLNNTEHYTEHDTEHARHGASAARCKRLGERDVIQSCTNHFTYSWGITCWSSALPPHSPARVRRCSASPGVMASFFGVSASVFR